MKKLSIAAIMATVALPLFASEPPQQQIALQDGSTLHIFENGRMAMENKYGRATSMEEGEVMVTKDGQRITMRGNEVLRLNFALKEHME
ncbi:MAG: CopK family periplasmic copper-binding protein [Pseudomonadota bacterium]|jgi:Copper resistance protein K|uniref:CopK family periplasmic copper-binding protein n=1 Tax=Massilia sp. TaxID=1882437 RepID=UPI0028AFEBC0|nr:CopK family periplasmic copper-binding protein [Massilia sp.]